MIHGALHLRVCDGHIFRTLCGRTVRCHSRVSPHPQGRVRNLTSGCASGRIPGRSPADTFPDRMWRMASQFDVAIRKGILEKKSLTSLTRVLPCYHCSFSSKICQAWALLSSEMLLVHIAVLNASPLEHRMVWWVRHSKGTLRKNVSFELLTCEAGRMPG